MHPRRYGTRLSLQYSPGQEKSCREKPIASVWGRVAQCVAVRVADRYEKVVVETESELAIDGALQ